MVNYTAKECLLLSGRKALVMPGLHAQVQYLHSALYVAGRGGLLRSGMRPPRQPNNVQWLRAIGDPLCPIVQLWACRKSFGSPSHDDGLHY